MRRCLSIVCAAAALAGGACIPAARADISYFTDRTTYHALPGAEVPVQVFARFTGADAAALVTENGLYSLGVSLLTTSSSPMGTPAVLTGPESAALNVADFDDSFGPLVDSPISPRFGAILLTDPFGNDGDLGVVGTPSGADRLVLIGTFTYTASPNLGEGTTIVVGDYDEQLSDSITWQTFQVLDPLLTSVRFAIAVTSNPACPADWDNDGVLTSQDFFDFLIAFFEGHANFNGLDDTNSQDFFEFLTAFFTGC